MTPCTKILCSYNAINAPDKQLIQRLFPRDNAIDVPRVEGVISGKMMLLLGLFPSNTLLLTVASLAPLPSSARTCSSVFPNASASGCAKKLERRMRWCFECAMGLCVVAGAMKSAGMSLVPWCTSW